MFKLVLTGIFLYAIAAILFKSYKNICNKPGHTPDEIDESIRNTAGVFGAIAMLLIFFGVLLGIWVGF